ncbi:hypothetical protein BV133_844 [Blastochloris viridis]|uniref:Uncharacterized protein n=1 Tax=Blastochloris viridis TaxID=1079 RepID=A0A182D0C2_BLAVI|nr:hypothetical protein BV133_844 [Blastochloris viridis]
MFVLFRQQHGMSPRPVRTGKIRSPGSGRPAGRSDVVVKRRVMRASSRRASSVRSTS